MADPYDAHPIDAGVARAQRASHLRIGTAERDTATDELRQHMIDGRLDLDELQTRLEGALQAKTAGDLAALLHDLPPLDGGPAHPHQGAVHPFPAPTAPVGPPSGRSALRWALVAPWASVNALMVLIWALTSPGGYFWPIWVMGPWGLAILPASVWPSRHRTHAGRCPPGRPVGPGRH